MNDTAVKRALSLIWVSSLFMAPASSAGGATGNGLIDDRGSGTLAANSGEEWRLVTDQVMGGRSDGHLRVDRHFGRGCLRLSGAVSTANNGGFIQAALRLGGGRRFDASVYSGLVLTVAGNGEEYSLHLKTSDLSLPWQSYRASFKAEPAWREIRIPFTEFVPYRTGNEFQPSRLERIGLVAIGRAFAADLCLADLGFYQEIDVARSSRQ